MISKDIKDIKLADLLKLQKQIDEELNKPKENGFIPRKRTLLDIKLTLDDEFQEWLRELPQELNFKTWKQREYSRENELIELTDVLFLMLQYINFKEDNVEKSNCCRVWDDFKLRFSIYNDEKDFSVEVEIFKQYLWFREYLSYAMMKYINIILLRGFTKEEIIKTYISKYKLIMAYYKREEVEKNGND